MIFAPLFRKKSFSLIALLGAAFFLVSYLMLREKYSGAELILRSLCVAVIPIIGGWVFEKYCWKPD